MESDASGAKENGWVIPHEASARGCHAQTPPFKSIQCAVADKTLEVAKQRKRAIPSSQSSASIMHKSPGVFSFNATYMTRPDSDLDDLDHLHTVDANTELSHRFPHLKPTPSKWDDAEKWLLPGTKAKSRSGPLLAQMVASQAEMSIPWKGHLFGQPVPTSKMATEVVDFTADEKVQLNLLLERYSVERGDGSLSPSCMNGSFMNLGHARTEATQPVAECSTRDMGTAMTPIPSVEPSRTGTPLRASTSEGTRIESCDEVVSKVESPRALTEKEMREKTRQEIVALGMQLGKANIAAAWAAKDSAVTRKAAPQDLETVQLASRADAWQEAQKAKYTFRYTLHHANFVTSEIHPSAQLYL